MKRLLYKTILLLQIIKEILSYNESIPFNFTQTPQYCYVEDFILSNNYRPFVDDIYPMKGCSSDERNRNYATNFGITNITFQPRLDFFFLNESYIRSDTDPPTHMTFRLNFPCSMHQLIFNNNKEYSYRIYFGRSDDYLKVREISQRTGKPIEYIDKKAILVGRLKYYKNELQDHVKNHIVITNFTSKDFDFYEYEGEYFSVTFDGYELDLKLNEVFDYNERRSSDNTYCENPSDYYALLIRVYDLPRMKVQGFFQYKGILLKAADKSEHYSNVYTVDTRNIFFQNISMFYNQRVNVSSYYGKDPTGEDSGFWVNTPCNQPQMATIMVDYFFFETIHKMQRFGYEFNDRFQLRIHTPYYRKTLTSSYSLFRYQWNSSYEKPTVFIHPIYKYKEYCDQYKNCTKFNYEEWSTDPKWTKYIIYIENEIVGNEIRINFSELEKIYAADGYNRTKLVINVNNTMTPHITQFANGLWAELYDTVTNDWVMKTKTTMDEVHGYIDDNEADPYRNFYLTCEIPDNITYDDIEFIVKKYGILQTAHLWFRLDAFNKGITKMYPPRFNVVFKFPPEILVTKDTFGYTYQYYKVPGDDEINSHWIFKDMRKTGLEDGVITNTSFDYKRNTINISELHPNFPSGDDINYYTQAYEYWCKQNSEGEKNCINLEIKRQFLYYFYDLSISLTTNRTGPIDITVYQVKYIPYHSKDQINRGLHRWNPYHAGWEIPQNAIFTDTKYNTKYYSYYFESLLDNFYYKPENSESYSNILGPTGVNAYSGPDCIFGFAGGSTVRNKSCEFWSGLMPDKPFTNYARDIYEEHIAYRTLNDDNYYTIDARTDVRAEYINFGVLDPYPGKFTGLLFEVFYWNTPYRAEQDGEPKCNEFYETPKGCKETSSSYKPVYNINKYPKEFFVKIKLPEGFSVNSTCIGKVLPCFWGNRGNSSISFYSLQDYLCYYVNDTYIYAFNSITQLGALSDSGLYDISLQVDGIYIYENITQVKKETGILKFGFYETTFFYAEYPRTEENPLYYNKNVSIEIKNTSMINDELGNLTIFIKATDWFIKDNIFRLDFSDFINNIELDKISYNGDYNKDFVNNLKEANGFNYNSEYYDTFWSYLSLPNGKEVGPSFVIAPYILYHNENPYPWNFSFIQEGESMIFEINFIYKYYRSFKPVTLDFYMSNLTYKTIFQHETLEFSNNVPQYLKNLNITPNSYYTNDRAIYTINFLTELNDLYDSDIFEFKSSWKTGFINKKDPDNDGYYINTIKFDKNISSNETLNITLYGNPILNPNILEEQYIKDIKILDKEGYIIAVYDEIIPIKMKKYIGFKYSEVNTVQSEDNSGIFDVNLRLVPEVLIDKNDSLKIKFSSGILLEKYSECLIEPIKGLNITDEDFSCEIDTKNNELVINNGFRDIGTVDFIFENQNSKALVDQEIIFTLKNIPIKQNHINNEKLFSIEIKTESQGIITQKNNLVSTANFKCGYKCKTCEKDNITLCLSCNEDYPIYFKDIKECHKTCPSDNYYIIINEEGNKECESCEKPCKSCEVEKNNCTSCYEPYFVENNKCVLNCSEGYSPDYKFGNCYKNTYMNRTIIEEKIIYVNISVPEPYNVFIENNICQNDD